MQQQNESKGNANICPFPYYNFVLDTYKIGKRSTDDAAVANHHQS